MPVEAHGGLPVDRRIENPSAAATFTREHEQARGIAAHPGEHLGERLQVLVLRQLPVGPVGPRVDPAAQPAECGVGVHGDDPVTAAQFGQHRSDAGGHRRFADTTLAQDTDLVVPAQRGADHGLHRGLAQLGARRSRVHQPECRGMDGAAPTAGRPGLGRRAHRGRGQRGIRRRSRRNPRDLYRRRPRWNGPPWRDGRRARPEPVTRGVVAVGHGISIAGPAIAQVAGCCERTVPKNPRRLCAKSHGGSAARFWWQTRHTTCGVAHRTRRGGVATANSVGPGPRSTSSGRSAGLGGSRHQKAT